MHIKLSLDTNALTHHGDGQRCVELEEEGLEALGLLNSLISIFGSAVFSQAIQQKDRELAKRFYEHAWRVKERQIEFVETT